MRFFHLLWNNLPVRLNVAHFLRHVFCMPVLNRYSVALCVGKLYAMRHRDPVAIEHALVVRLFHLLWNILPVRFHLAHFLRHVFCMPVLNRYSVALCVGKLYAMRHRDPVAIEHILLLHFFHLLGINVPVHLSVAHPLRHIFCVPVFLGDSVTLCLGERNAVRLRDLVAI